MRGEGDRVCPVELAGGLDNRVRRWLQDPRRILAPFVREGMSALDVGCGPGFFTVELAHLVGPTGTVVAADLQDGMLARLAAKVKGTPLEGRIEFVKSGVDAIGASRPVDFALAFYMVHEVPDKERFFRQLRTLLRPGGRGLLVEPKLFHVSRTAWEVTLRIAESCGFAPRPGPKLLLSWSAVLDPAAPAG
jgi:ubiquinone/menaquinone biosynthesis C-methylase UbiE